MANLEVAQTILQQLGGRRFLTMTGARNLVGSSNTLSFKLPRAAKKITHVIVTLDPSDTYTVEFLNCRTTPKRMIRETVASHADVYAEDLDSIFTSETGLYTRL
jgi:hypothetical protein